MTAYAFANLRTRRPHLDIVEYLERIQATLTPYAGRFLVHGAPTEVLEGSWPGHMVLIEFPDAATARAWYDSPGYRAILPLRTAHIEADVVLAEGVGPDYDPAASAAYVRAEVERAAANA
ncbi:DUF1330 domain-containing protein [Kitasatospora sp. NPDC096147]|uniref:DUF1330 domain-containing protein n=1 Tax=Kitasatospora sp. NPDC096147 TaxID=3364093 RepID=UPI0037F914CC